MPYKHIVFDNIEEGLDRKQLTLLKKRFLDINRQRLDRSKQSLGQKQRLFIDVLPLLFHVNHASLPGFVSHATPAGVQKFKPDKEHFRDAKTIARSFRYNPAIERQCHIEAIFMMGSMGTLGQSMHSDLDIWICHSPSLSPNDLSELQLKADNITNWADNESIEVHFFLMNAENFRQGVGADLSEESSGTTQHKLLLDEFYRTAIYLSGKLPLWWFISSEDEYRYEEISQLLLDRRYLDPDEVIDFGSTLPIPAREFIGAATWQLYKAIGSPYKSILKLILLEVYAEQLNSDLGLALSQRFKQRIYEGTLDIDRLDPYVMMYEQIENYLLGKEQLDRLNILRRCFYFKTNQQLSRQINNSVYAWQRELLSHIIADWGWTNEKIHHLDNRRQWKALQVVSEKNSLFNELMSSYRFLHDFTEQSTEVSEKTSLDIVVLGRKLYAAYERAAGKIEWINPAISRDISETKLVIREKINQKNETEFDVASNALGAPKILKTATSMAELIIWCYRNQILTGDTDLQYSFRNQRSRGFISLLSTLNEWHPQIFTEVKHENYLHPAHSDAILFFINLESEDEETVVIEPDQQESDPLRYGRKKEILIKDICLTFHNSWDEVYCFHFRQQPINAVLLEYIRLLTRAKFRSSQEDTLYSPPSHYRNLILRRFENLTRRIKDFFLQNHHHKESIFIFPLGEGYSCIKLENMNPSITFSPDTEQLLAFLEKPHTDLCKINFDVQEKSLPISYVSQHLKPDSIQIFVYKRNSHFELFIFDERNTLTFITQPLSEEAFLLRPLHRFFRNIFNRHAISDNTIIGFDLYPVEFFQLTSSTKNQMLCQRLSVENNLRGLSTINLQVLVYPDSNQGMKYVFRCNEREFHLNDDNTDALREVAEFILSSRKDKTLYPCYITDLDLSQVESLLECRQGIQTSHHLQIKRHLEQKLNHAIHIYAPL